LYNFDFTGEQGRAVEIDKEKLSPEERKKYTCLAEMQQIPLF
jgi:hypothetical protein